MIISWIAILFLIGFIGVEAPITWFRLRIELDIKVVIHCNNEPNATYNIELWEMDNNWSDELIDKSEVKLSDHRGEISLKGQAKDSTMELCVEPYIIIRSDCSDRIGAYGYRGGRFDLYFDAHPKYCYELSQCPECVVYHDVGTPNARKIRTCHKELCEDYDDHCVYNDYWSHTVYIRETDDRRHPYGYYDESSYVKGRFICDELPNL